MRARISPRHLFLTVTFLAASLVAVACGEPAEDPDVREDMPETAERTEMVERTPADDPMEGEYTLREDRRVVVEDGSYTVYAGDEVVVVGDYMYEGDRVIFVDREGPMACGPDQRGVYTLHMEEGEPNLHLVEDPCEGRRVDIIGENGS